MSKLFFVGDSITAGAWDEKAGWASRLIGVIMNQTISTNFKPDHFYCLSYNLGVSGNTSADILVRLEREISARKDPDNLDESTQIVMAVGTNDSVFLLNENKPRFSEEEFAENIDALIHESKKLARSVSFIGLLPVDESLTNPVPWAPENAYINERVVLFENIIRKACVKENIPFLPLFEHWRALPDHKSLFIDGLHPNSKGHEKMAGQIADFLFTDEFKDFHSKD